MSKVCFNTNCYNEVKGTGRKCNTCVSIEWRAKNPMRSVYNNKRCDAHRKGIPFHITYKQFKKWCKDNDFMSNIGLHSEANTIDRKEVISDDGIIMGYTIDNIQKLSLKDNSAKSHIDRRKRWAKKRAVVDPEVPF